MRFIFQILGSKVLRIAFFNVRTKKERTKIYVLVRYLYISELIKNNFDI